MKIGESIVAVVLPVYNSFLTTLVHRSDTFTTMTWGWQGQGQGTRMVRPGELLAKEEQSHLPFLFSETEQPTKKVTHIAVSQLVVHVEDVKASPEFSTWLQKHRVEKFARKQRVGDTENLADHELEGSSVYVVSACRCLTEQEQIEYANLRLVSEDRPLDANKQRGYSIVKLPSRLSDWYSEAIGLWDHLFDPNLRTL